MESLEEYKASEELRKKRYWKGLSKVDRHMVLMYFYRLKTNTDMAQMETYLETYRFRRLKITPDDVPDYLSRLSPRDLREEAYDMIGKPLPPDEARATFIDPPRDMV